MSSNCPYFDNLNTRLEELKNKYLQKDIENERDGFLSEPDLDNIASFIILIHAEIEHYFECKAKEKLNIADRNFKNGTVIGKDMLSLVYTRLMRDLTEKEDSLEITLTGNLKSYTQEAIGVCRRIVKDNNGIKESSIKYISTMIGKPIDEVNSTLIAELDQLGKRRGEIAHKGKAQWKNINSANQEYTQIRNILDLIKEEYE